MKTLQFPGIRYQQVPEPKTRAALLDTNAHLKALYEFFNAAIQTDNVRGTLSIDAPVVIPELYQAPTGRSRFGANGQLAKVGDDVYMKVNNIAEDTDWTTLLTGATAFASPTALVGLTAVPGILAKAMRSDASPPLDQTIDPTMTGTWNYTPTDDVVPITVNATNLVTGNMQTWSPTDGLDTIVDKDGNVGVSDEAPTAMLSIRARASTVLDLAPVVWLKAENYSSAAEFNPWTDSSGHGHTPIAHQWCSTDGIDGHTGDPTYYPRHNAAGSARAIANLDSVDGNYRQNVPFPPHNNEGVFVFPSPLPTMGAATGGLTLFFIIRDSSGVAGGTVGAGAETTIIFGTSGSSFKQIVLGDDGSIGTKAMRPRTDNFGGKFFCPPIGCPDGNDTEIWGLRIAATSGALSATFDGVLQASSGDVDTSAFTFDRFGQGSVWGGWREKSFCEVLLFDRELNDTEMAFVNDYLISRRDASSPTSSAVDLTHWKRSDGTIDSVVDSSINFGLGTATPQAKLHVVGDVIFEGDTSLELINSLGFVTTIDTSGVTGDQTLVINDVSGSAFENNIVTGGIQVASYGSTAPLAIWNLGMQGVVGGSPYFTTDNALRQIVVGEPGSSAFGMQPGIKFMSLGNTATITLDGTGPSGIMTMDAPGSGGRWVMKGNTSTAVFTVQGSTGMSAAQYNGVAITPAISGTLKIGDGATFDLLTTKVLTVNGTVTMDGVDGAVIDWGAGGTIAYTTALPVAGNPVSPSVKLAVTNGVAPTFMRSDAVLELDQTITPTWTNPHTYSHANPIVLSNTAGGIIGTSGNNTSGFGLKIQNSVQLTGSKRLFEVDWINAGAVQQEMFGLWSQAGSTKAMGLFYDSTHSLITTVNSSGNVNSAATGSWNLSAGTSYQLSAGTNLTLLATGGAILLGAANIQWNDPVTVTSGSTTGAKIGAATDKLGFYSVTPVVRPTIGGTAAAAFVANTSGIVNDSATFAGYTLGQIAQALKNLGFLT